MPIVLAVAVSSHNLVPVTGQWLCSANIIQYLLDGYWGHAGQPLVYREEKCDRDDHVHCRTMEEKYFVLERNYAQESVTETTMSIVERWKKSILFLNAIMHRKV